MFNWLNSAPSSQALYNHVMGNMDKIRMVPLKNPKYMQPGDKDAKRDLRYVYVVGLFREDMFYINISDVVWYCRADGLIWTEWFDYRKGRREEEPERRMMKQWHSNKINELTKELLVMHKLSPDYG